MVEAYILVQTEVGKASDVAALIGKITRGDAGRGRHRPVRRDRPSAGRQRGRARPAGRRAHPGRARDHQDTHLPCGAHLSSSAASGAVRGPRPSAAAARRSAGVSTSRRRPGTPSRPSSAAPPAACRDRDAPPNAGRNATPGAAVYSVVPSPGRIGHERVRPGGGGAQGAGQLKRAQRGQVGRTAPPGRRPATAARRTRRRAAARRSGRPAARRGPPARPARPARPPPTSSSVMTTTRAAASHVSTTDSVSLASARASSPRRGPASGASLDLAWASTLTGISTDQVIRALSVM